MQLARLKTSQHLYGYTELRAGWCVKVLERRSDKCLVLAEYIDRFDHDWQWEIPNDELEFLETEEV